MPNIIIIQSVGYKKEGENIVSQVFTSKPIELNNTLYADYQNGKYAPPALKLPKGYFGSPEEAGQKEPKYKPTSSLEKLNKSLEVEVD